MRKCKSQILIGETSKKSEKEENTQYENDNLPVVDCHENLTSTNSEFANAKVESRPMRSRRLPVWHDNFVEQYKI